MLEGVVDAIGALFRQFRKVCVEIHRFLADPRGYLQELRVRYRRHKLVMAYAKVGKVRYGLGPGFSPLLYAYGRLDDEDLATLTEDGLEWHWPETTARGEA